MHLKLLQTDESETKNLLEKYVKNNREKYVEKNNSKLLMILY